MTSGDGDQTTPMQPSYSEVLAETRVALERFAHMRTVAEQVLVTETSAAGDVTVTVNSGGVLTDLRITDQALRLSGARIAAVVLATMRQAQARLANRMNDVMQATMGEDKQTMDRVLTVYRDRFPEPELDRQPSTSDTEMRFEQPIDQPPAPTPARTPTPRRPRPAAVEDDWDAGNPIMK